MIELRVQRELAGINEIKTEELASLDVILADSNATDKAKEEAGLSRIDILANAERALQATIKQGQADVAEAQRREDERTADKRRQNAEREQREREQRENERERTIASIAKIEQSAIDSLLRAENDRLKAIEVRRERSLNTLRDLRNEAIENGANAKEVDAQIQSARVQVTLQADAEIAQERICLLYTSPSPRDQRGSRMPSSA